MTSLSSAAPTNAMKAHPGHETIAADFSDGPIFQEPLLPNQSAHRTAFGR
jgi:hypothetical protein